MKKRLRSILRVLRVQADLHRLEEEKLATLVRRETALADERDELIGALNDHQVFYGAFIYPMAKRLRAVEEAEGRLRRDKEVQSRKVLEQAGRKKRAERLFTAVTGEWQREEAKRDLTEMIERAAGNTSLP